MTPGKDDLRTPSALHRAMQDSDGQVRDERGIRIAPGSVIGLTREWQRRKALLQAERKEQTT